MATRQDATLNLASLLKQDLSTGGEVEGSGRLMPAEERLEHAGLRLEEPLDWRLTVRGAGGDDYLLSGSVSGTAVLECRRCLTEVPTASRSDIFYAMQFRPGAKELKLVEHADDGEDLLVFGKPEVDFAPLLTQVFAIDLPLTVLCKESCRGLSLQGVNLNDHPDVVDAERQPDKEESPFAVLKDLEF